MSHVGCTQQAQGDELDLQACFGFYVERQMWAGG